MMLRMRCLRRNLEKLRATALLYKKYKLSRAKKTEIEMTTTKVVVRYTETSCCITLISDQNIVVVYDVYVLVDTGK